MKKLTFIMTIGILFLTLVCPLMAQDGPVIEWADYYTDYWYDNPFGNDGYHHVVCGYVEGQVTVWVTDGINDRHITGGPWYCRFVENDPFTGETLTIVADDGTNPPVSRETNTLNNPIVMNKASNIIFSDNSTSPIVSWAEDTLASRYYLRVIDVSGNEIHSSPPLDLPKYKIPSNVLTVSQIYYFRLLNQNYDECDVYSWGTCLENRSSTWVEFTPHNNSELVLIDIDPDTLNLKARGNYVTCYIEVPESGNPDIIDVASIEIYRVNNNYLSNSLSTVGPSGIGDHNNNGVLDLMVKFDRQSLYNILSEGPVNIWLSCNDYQGNNYTGLDTCLVIEKGKEHINENHDSVIY